MKKTRNKFLFIEGTVFPFDILVTTAETDEIIKWSLSKKKYTLDIEERKLLEMEGRGRTVRLKTRAIIVRVKPEKTEIGFDLPTMVHELFHAVALTMSDVGIKLDDSSEEVYAYYLDYLTEKVLQHYE